MSVGVSVRAGDPVPIHLKLDDRDESKFGQALIYDEAQGLITTVVLAHVNNGFYLPSAPYFMPGNLFIKVDYRVFNDVGLTDEDTSYRVEPDIFTKQNAAPGLKETSDFTASFNDETLEAVLDISENITAVFSDETLEGTIPSDQNLTGTISNETLAGEIKC